MQKRTDVGFILTSNQKLNNLALKTIIQGVMDQSSTTGS